jgi:hypothetical protein
MAGRIKSVEKSNDNIGKRTRDIPACSMVPQPTTLLRLPNKKYTKETYNSKEDYSY